MRAAFIKALTELARADGRIFLLVGDLGYSVVEGFAREFLDRFINTGISEQNMTGIAAGLALSGKIVFTYSIANFPTLRCLEQIRNDLCYHNANVKIVAVGGGLTYGTHGVTHHGTEDLAVMRALPNMTVLAPGDPAEAYLATRAVAEWAGPCYLRLGKAGEPPVHEALSQFQIGKAITIREGNDITLIATGGMLHTAAEVGRSLAEQGIQARILSLPTIKPMDEEAILKAARETRAICTLEEHSVVGGMGGAVAELVAESGLSNIFFKRLGLDDTFYHKIGSQEFLRKEAGLTVQEIVRKIKLYLSKYKSRAGSDVSI